MVPWNAALASGVTVVVGMCHRLPDVTLANIKCLTKNDWPDLKEIIVVVDAEEGSVLSNLVDSVIAAADSIEVRFIYYSHRQAQVTERFKSSYVFAWLSWSIGVVSARYRYLLLHDYDALILDGYPQSRFAEFRNSRCKVQGVSWYNNNRLEEADRLSTTFEAFIDLEWLIQFKPVDFFTQVGFLNDRICDFYILLRPAGKTTR